MFYVTGILQKCYIYCKKFWNLHGVVIFFLIYSKSIMNRTAIPLKVLVLSPILVNLNLLHKCTFVRFGLAVLENK